MIFGGCYTVNAIILLLIFTIIDGFSYSKVGEWKDTTHDNLYHKYKDEFLLVFGNHTWIQENAGDSFPINKLYDNRYACEKLVNKGIDTIYFYGDSYMRQVYAAVVITLNGNYVNGSISTSEYAANEGGGGCKYHQQFNEKACGIRQLDEDALVCDGKIQMHHMHHSMFNIDSCRRRAESGAGKSNKAAINIFSTGNHQIGNGRSGVNDAPAHQTLFDQSFCGQLKEEHEKVQNKDIDDPSNGCVNWWLSTHHRIIGWFPDEKGPITIAFNEGMRQYFDAGQCGAYNYIDVYNMTQSLVEKFTLDATCEENKQKSMSVSYDYVHYGMEINLIKAQIIVDAWVTGMPDSEAELSIQRRKQQRLRHAMKV